MPTQNLNTYYYPKYKTFLNSRQYFDLTLAADERDYDEEFVFSNDIIGASYKFNSFMTPRKSLE